MSNWFFPPTIPSYKLERVNLISDLETLITRIVSRAIIYAHVAPIFVGRITHHTDPLFLYRLDSSQTIVPFAILDHGYHVKGPTALTACWRRAGGGHMSKSGPEVCHLGTQGCPCRPVVRGLKTHTSSLRRKCPGHQGVHFWHHSNRWGIPSWHFLSGCFPEERLDTGKARMAGWDPASLTIRLCGGRGCKPTGG